ncbi:hypothetical protein [Streptomyces gilvifuscus]|uniref:Uncharacterized protein n=1 Tax=Streptomyces gilvifuscus TaxID=1550617 RepID=A0ABT5G371_9ACTN|nr:hypothetical protein [Streptomyces gilvifuscus]MDC2959289.1 hypothetical protein [Streptomyces gilvifuscus]
MAHPVVRDCLKSLVQGLDPRSAAGSHQGLRLRPAGQQPGRPLLGLPSGLRLPFR